VAIELDKMESLMGTTVCDCGRSPTLLPRDGVAVYPEAQPFRFKTSCAMRTTLST
jgi:hypothetical protein